VFVALLSYNMHTNRAWYRTSKQFLLRLEAENSFTQYVHNDHVCIKMRSAGSSPETLRYEIMQAYDEPSARMPRHGVVQHCLPWYTDAKSLQVAQVCGTSSVHGGPAI